MENCVFKFKNEVEYFKKVNKLISRFIKDPSNLDGILRCRYFKNRLIGWEIENVKFSFDNAEGYLKISEYAQVNATDWFLKWFSYHFQPQNEELYKYRIDFDNVSLHANPDEELGLDHHLNYPTDIKLQINQYNLAVAIFIAFAYMNTKNYPLENSHEQFFNDIIRHTNGGL